MILNLVAAGFAILPIFSVPSEIEKAINPLYKRYNRKQFCSQAPKIAYRQAKTATAYSAYIAVSYSYIKNLLSF